MDLVLWDLAARLMDLPLYRLLGARGSRTVELYDGSIYIDDLEGSLANMRTALDGWEVRVIVCLRDPLERAFSHYLHDAAQHQKLFGHGDFGFWSPTVMARYLFPVAPRVARLQEVFGKAQVAGFAFGANPGETETVLRDFANLGPDWRLDFSENPAPGCTAPQSLYNADAETEVPLQGRRIFAKGKGAFAAAANQRVETKIRLIKSVVRIQGHTGRCPDGACLDGNEPDVVSITVIHVADDYIGRTENSGAPRGVNDLTLIEDQDSDAV